jgi:membrane protease YdiL (CAAX protease family)
VKRIRDSVKRVALVSTSRGWILQAVWCVLFGVLMTTLTHASNSRMKPWAEAFGLAALLFSGWVIHKRGGRG